MVKNLMVDAKTTSRWYYVVAMGRKAGHLALGIGKAAGATITLIPEEFTTAPVPLARIVDTLVGAHIKRLAARRRDGVAVIAEGVALAVDPRDLDALENTERDDHGHVRLDEITSAEVLKQAVQERLRDFGSTPRSHEEHRLRAALRRPDPVRHGVHARPGLLRRQVPAGRRRRRHGVAPGRGVRAGPVRSADRSRDRARAGAARGREHHALRDRAPLHAAAAPGRLRVGRAACGRWPT
jgi:hypothetical protein